MKYFLYIFLLIPMMCYSQDVTIMQDKSAEPVLDEVASEFDQEKAYQVEFRYEIFSQAENATVGDFGSVIIKGSKYKLKTEDAQVIYNGEYLWTYNIINAEVYKSEPSDENPDQMLIDPFRLLADYKKFYKYKNFGEENLNNQKLNKIVLYPIDLETVYSMIEIYTSEKTGQLYSIVVKQKDGIILSIFINDIIKNLKISDESFNWNEEDYPDVLLIEM